MDIAEIKVRAAELRPIRNKTDAGDIDYLLAEVERLERELAKYKKTDDVRKVVMGAALNGHLDMIHEVEALNAQNALLREALEKAAYTRCYDGYGQPHIECRVCHQLDGQHIATCEYGIALKGL